MIYRNAGEATLTETKKRTHTPRNPDKTSATLHGYYSTRPPMSFYKIL
jgi:hypothetical protein